MSPLEDQPGAGLRDLVLRLDGQPVSTSAVACFDDVECEDARAWEWNTTATANGLHTITVTATDRAGNEAMDEFTVDLQRAADQLPRTNTVVRKTIVGAGAGDRAGTSLAAVGDVNGDGHADYLVGAPGVSAGGASATGAAYLVLGSEDVSTVDLRTPGPAVRTLVYVVKGDHVTADVDLADPGTRAVTLTSGQPGDRFGVYVTSLGDTDIDSTPDFAIATSSGAYIVRELPKTSRQVSVDDGFRITGPTNTPTLLATHVPGAPIGSAGDLDGDQRADLVVGYPDTAGSRAYTIRSPEAARTINVLALPGQRGASINSGTQADRSGAAVAANPFQGKTPVTENGQVIIGAPEASPDLVRSAAGRAYVLGEPAPDGPGADPDMTDGNLVTGMAGTRSQSLRAAASTSAQSQPLRSPVPGRYTIGLVSPNTNWATVRNDLQQFVIGNAAEGEGFNVDYQKLSDKGGSGGELKLYFHGRFLGDSQRCGWALADKAPGEGTPLLPGGLGACGGKQRIRPKAFAALMNCDQCNDGSPVKLRSQYKDKAGQSLPLPAQIPVYRNVRPGGEERALSRDGSLSTTLSDGTRTVVNWRYITKMGKFVLARLPFRNNKWAFIERRYLPPTFGKYGLCDNTEGRAPGTILGAIIRNGKIDTDAETVDYASEAATDNQTRKGRSDWARVCSHRKYTVQHPE